MKLLKFCLFLSCLSLGACGWIKTSITGTNALSAAYCSTRLNSTPFAGGSGTSVDPYIICSETQFQQILSYNTNSFQLGADIDFSSSAATSPILIDEGFALDGGNYALKNWTVSAVTGVGLFTYLPAAGTGNAVSISNLNINNFNLTGTGPSGCLISVLSTTGSAANFSLSNINISSCTVLNSTNASGAVIGQMTHAGTGTFSISGITVTSPSITATTGQAGGVVGHIPTISAGLTVTFSSITVSGGTVATLGIQDFAGGIIGKVNSNAGTLNMSSVDSRRFCLPNC